MIRKLIDLVIMIIGIIGASAFLFSICCLDSEGVAFQYFSVICLIGAILVIAYLVINHLFKF